MAFSGAWDEREREGLKRQADDFFRAFAFAQKDVYRRSDDGWMGLCWYESLLYLVRKGVCAVVAFLCCNQFYSSVCALLSTFDREMRAVVLLLDHTYMIYLKGVVQCSVVLDFDPWKKKEK